MRNKFAQQLQLLCHQLAAKKGHTGRVATGPVKTVNKPARDRIGSRGEYDGNGLVRLNHCANAGNVAANEHHRDFAFNQIGRDFGHQSGNRF